MSILTRYLPPVPQATAAKMVAENALKGKLAIDPFGAAPSWNAAAAYAGVRLILAANNPISRLLTEIAAAPPAADEAHNVLAALAAARVRDERMELHLRALYTTFCPACEREIQAQALIWKREADTPFARLLHCPHCGVHGEFQATDADREQAARFAGERLHHARALERVVPRDDPDRTHAERALSVYPPRAIYALLTIVNKLDTLDLDPRARRILDVMLLHAFDRGNTLWPHPVARSRPKRLTVPPVYRENNIWLALEEAADSLTQVPDPTPVPLTRWPELPPDDGGICLYEGRIKSLAEQLGETVPEAVLTVFPRQNQAFWSLSALWAGWLWGHDAVEHFRAVLRRRRYDWSWHTTALHAALASIRPALLEDIPVLGMLGEAEPGFISAVIIAAHRADFSLETVALDETEKQVAFSWNLRPIPASAGERTPQGITNALRDAARAHLLGRGEPCIYLPLDSAALTALAQRNLFPETDTPAECYAKTRQAAQNAFTYHNGFLRFGGGEKKPESGLWWLTDDKAAAAPLADRTEMAVVRYLMKSPGCTLDELEDALKAEFNSLMRPPRELVMACLGSYGKPFGAGWKLREQDAPPKRRAELAAIGRLLSRIGKKLRFRVHSPQNETQPLIWQDAFGQPRYTFFVSASALLGKFLIKQEVAPARGMLVVPGGRANLVMYKLRRDPRLMQIYEANWRIVKYRQIRQLSENAMLTPENFEAQLLLDPLTYDDEQLRLL